MAITGASLQPIYERLHAVQGYHPMSADTFADWAVEAGDMVTMSRDGEEIVSPVHNAKIVWRGSPQITLNSTGNEERESIARISRKKYGRGGGMMNDQSIHRDLYDENGILHSELHYTESRLTIEFQQGLTSVSVQFESELEMTASLFDLALRDNVSSLRGELEMTASYLQTEFDDGLNSLHGELVMTASYLQTEFTDDINSLHGELDMTASRLQTEFTDDINSLHGELVVTASRLESDFTDDINSLRGEFEVTASRMRTEYTDGINSLHGELQVTASFLQTEFSDGINSLHGELQVTASFLQTEFTNDISSVHSELIQTASSLQSDIEDTASNLGSRITQQANRINLVVEGTGANAHIKAAQIVASINAQTGQSEVLLSADKVALDGNTTINDVMTITDNRVYITTDMRVPGDVMVESLTLRTAADSQTLTEAILSAMIKEASVSGNTLTLTKFNGDVINFSKATSLSGAWSSGHLEVTASPQGTKFHQYLIDSEEKVNNDWTEYTSGPIWYVPVYWKYDQLEPTTHSTEYKIKVDTTDMLQTKTVTSNGVVYPDSGYLGLESVDVQVPAPSVVPVISYAWSSTGQLTVSTTPAAQADLVRRLGQDTSSISWNGNTATIPIVARFTVDSQERSEATNFNATVDATSRYRAGSLNVNLADPTWSTPAGTNITVSENTATVSTTGRVNSSGADANVSKTVPIKTSQGDWNTSTNKKYVYVHYSSTSNTNRIARVEVDAGTIYSNGVTAGKNAVTISKTYDTANSRVVFAKSEGTANTKAVRIGVDGSWSGNTYTYRIKDYEDNSSGTNIETNARTVDASARYTAGQNAVTLNNPSWSNGSPYTSGATNTATVSTSGRPTQLSKTVPVTLVQNSWSGNSKTVDIQTTNGAVVARITVDASSIRTAGKNDVTLNDASWNSVSSITASRTVTVSTSGRPTQLSKSKTVYLTVGSWSSGSIPVYIRDGSTSGTIVAQNSVSMPAVSSTTWTNTSGRTWRADISIGGVTRSSDTKDFSWYYTDGVYDGETGVTQSYNPNSRYVDTIRHDGTWTGNLGYYIGDLLDAWYNSGYNSGYSAGESSGISTERGRVRTRFGSSSGGYYIEAYENITGAPSIANSSKVYKLALSAGNTRSSVVQVVDANGNKYANTATLSLTAFYDQAVYDGEGGVMQTYNSTSRYVDTLRHDGTWTGVFGYYIGDLLDAEYQRGIAEAHANSMYLTRQYTYTDSTPTTRYYGILYWKNSGGGYTACTDSSCYWYRSGTNISSRTVYY